MKTIENDWHYSPCHAPGCDVKYASGYYCSICEDERNDNENS